MNEKNLPIKFFEKRKKYDDRDTEGGGSSKVPSWVLSGKELKDHSASLQNEINNVKRKFSAWRSEGKKLPMIISSTIKEDAIAKSHRSKISGVLESDGKENIIGLWGSDRLLSLVTNEQLLNNILNNLSDTQNMAQLISSIEEIDVFRPYIERDEQEKVYKIKLINYNDYDLNLLSMINFEESCNKNGVNIQAKTRYTPELIVYRITIDNVEQLDLLEQFEGLFSAEPMEQFEVTLDWLDEEAEIVIKKPREDIEYPIVGVLDTGISKNKYLDSWILEKKFTSYPEEYQDNKHGTFVAGLVAYGDELNESQTATLDGIKIFDATVYPDVKCESIYPDELVDHIREAVEKNHNIKIWNLSLGTNVEAELDEFSDFGMALDSIQDENNVLIIKSVGNCSNFLQGKGKSRVAKSADSVRSIVVGSLAQEKGLYDYADANTPSPFTRIGPGPSSIIKPDLVYYGGNAGKNDLGKLVKHGIASFDMNGNVIKDSGTSFSTPRITRIAAELNHFIKDDFDPLLIRALMIHSAKYPSNNVMAMTDKVSQMGFGVPESTQDILYNSQDEITLILRDTLEKGSFIEMFDFPFPDSLVDENGYFIGQISLTLVNKCVLDAKQSGEYCQSDINVAFGTYDTEKDRDITKPTVKNPKGIDEGKNVLLDSLYSARVMKSMPGNGFERECTLVRYGKKFHPVKKYAVDLADMTPSNKEHFLKSNRKWYLKVDGLYRDFIEKDAQKRNYQLNQEYCMILTIKDPTGIAPVYDEVTQKLTLNNFVHYNVNVRNTVVVSSELE